MRASFSPILRVSRSRLSRNVSAEEGEHVNDETTHLGNVDPAPKAKPFSTRSPCRHDANPPFRGALFRWPRRADDVKAVKGKKRKQENQKRHQAVRNRSPHLPASFALFPAELPYEADRGKEGAGAGRLGEEESAADVVYIHEEREKPLLPPTRREIFRPRRTWRSPPPPLNHSPPFFFFFLSVHVEPLIVLFRVSILPSCRSFIMRWGYRLSSARRRRCVSAAAQMGPAKLTRTPGK